MRGRLGCPVRLQDSEAPRLELLGAQLVVGRVLDLFEGQALRRGDLDLG